MKKMLIALLSLTAIAANVVAGDCGCCPTCEKTIKVQVPARKVVQCQSHWECPSDPNSCDTPGARLTEAQAHAPVVHGR